MSGQRVALLRGINVGKAKRIAMADLRKLFETMGYADVRTLLNSGNVVFAAQGKSAGEDARIEKAIATRLGVSTQVTVLSRDDLAEAVQRNPLAKVADNPSRFLLLVPRDARAVAQLKPLLKERWAPEALALGKRVAYLWCAGGILDSPLWKRVERTLEDGCTARNMATMTKLLALADGGGRPTKK